MSYPSWLPHRPPPPGPHSSQNSFSTTDDKPVQGRKPTPRSVRIVNLNPPQKVWSRASLPVYSSANPVTQQLPIPQPRFNAKYLHIQLLRSPSPWMKAYFYLWPFIVFYHIPLQSFFDFNAVYILFQVTKYPSLNSTTKSWSLATTAYIACWLGWIFLVVITYELIYSFARRWRLRRPLILPIYLSSSAFNLVALSSFSTFSFLQHIRLSAFSQEQADAIAPLPSIADNSHQYSKLHSRSDSQDNTIDNPPPTHYASLSQFFAESAYFYSQNLPTVGLLLPRAGLCLALLFSFSSPEILDNPSQRDATFFNRDASLTTYASAVLIANASWTAWRSLVLLLSWLGLWFFSSQPLAGLSGPRHIWDEREQEKTRIAYSSAASEHGARDSVLYQSSRNSQHLLHDGNRTAEGYYGGDELPWVWREHTRMRVQDAFEFCLTSGRSRRPDRLVWSHHQHPERYQRRRSMKGKEPAYGDGDEKIGVAETREFDGVEDVLAAIGFGAVPASPSAAARRGALTRDMFDTPEPEPEEEEAAAAAAMKVPEASSSSSPVVLLPKMAKRNSRDKEIFSSSRNAAVSAAAPTVPGAPLLALPYPFTQPGAGRVSSRDLVPFPGVGGSPTSQASRNGQSSSSASGSGSTGTTGSTEEESEDEEDEEEEEEEEEEGSEDPSSNRRSESMSSLGQPISPVRGGGGGAPLRSRMHGHARHASGVSSGLSSAGGGGARGRRSTSSGATGATGSFSGGGGGGYTYSFSGASSSAGAGGVRSSLDAGTGSEGIRRGGGKSSIASQSTGNRSTAEESISVSGSSRAGSGIPMPPRHPNLQVVGGGGSLQVPQGRTRKVAISAPSSSTSSASSLVSGSVRSAGARMSVPLPCLAVQRGSGSSAVVFPSAATGGAGVGGEVEGRYEDRAGGFAGYEWGGVGEGGGDEDGGGEAEGGEEEEEEEDESGEREDRVGLLVPSPRVSLVSISGNSNNNNGGGGGGGASGGGRSRTHSFHSFVSSSASSSTKSRARSRTHSATSNASAGAAAAAVRERASSVGHSVRSLVGAATAGLVLGGSRSRVNSSMARLEEEEDVGVLGEFGERGEAHSRSGSEGEGESVSGENYTFGRPVVFMKSGGGGERESDHHRAGIDIPGRRRGGGVGGGGVGVSEEVGEDISTAPGSFVTAPPSVSVEGGDGGGSASTLGRDEEGVVGGRMGGRPGDWRIA